MHGKNARPLNEVAHLTGPGHSGGRAGTASGEGFQPGGWATPRSGKTTDEDPETWAKRKAKGDVATMPLTTQARMAGWATATVNDAKSGANQTARRNNPNSKHHDGQTLVDQSRMAGYPTPRRVHRSPSSSRRASLPVFGAPSEDLQGPRESASAVRMTVIGPKDDRSRTANRRPPTS